MTRQTLKSNGLEERNSSVIYERTIRVSKSHADFPMDVLHQFIKNIKIEKSQILRTEIFEAPPKAVLSIRQKSKRVRKPLSGDNFSPSHFLEIDLMPVGCDEGSIYLHYRIDEVRQTKTAKTIGQYFGQKSRDFVAFMGPAERKVIKGQLEYEL